MPPSPRILLAACLLTLPLISGCSVLIGNVKPVEEKSENYRITDLSKLGGDWMKLANSTAPEGGGDKGTSDSSADLSYQSKLTSSIISLNSACRPENQEQSENLQEFSRLLFLGITEVTQKEERKAEVDHVPALQTTLEGKLNGETTKLRTVVVRKAGCVYDLMYIARPERFSEREEDFTRFVSSLKLR